MEHVAVLGLGAMGARMAHNLIRAGHELTVWNRTPAAADPLVVTGAKLAATPAEAVADADFVMAMVRDDAASHSVWCDPKHGALAAMRPNALAIESSTLSPAWVRKLGKIAAEHGHGLVEAPVSGTRPQAESGQLIYLLGGADVDIERATPLLQAMGSALHHAGPLGAGALAKLCTNTLLGIQVTVLAELIGLLQREGVDAARVLDTVAGTAVWSQTCARTTQAMLAGSFAPQFPVELIEKDFGYTVDAAGSAALAPTIAAARQVFRDGIAQGLGTLNMTSVVKLFTQP